jgi:hypothetical protein
MKKSSTIDRETRNERRRLAAQRKRAYDAGYEAGQDWVHYEESCGTEELARLAEFYEPGEAETLDAEKIAIAIADLDPNGEREDGVLVAASEFWGYGWCGLENDHDFARGFVEGALCAYEYLQLKFGI